MKKRSKKILALFLSFAMTASMTGNLAMAEEMTDLEFSSEILAVEAEDMILEQTAEEVWETTETESVEAVSETAMMESEEQVSETEGMEAAEISLISEEMMESEALETEDIVLSEEDDFFSAEEEINLLADTNDLVLASDSLVGVCGPDATWEFSDGVLYIHGTGRMYDHWEERDEEDYYERGYVDLQDEIKELCIDEGITEIGEFAFADLFRLTKATIPSSVTRIGHSAFQTCYDLINVSVSEDLLSTLDMDDVFSYSKFLRTRDEIEEIGTGEVSVIYGNPERFSLLTPSESGNYSIYYEDTFDVNVYDMNWNLLPDMQKCEEWFGQYASCLNVPLVAGQSYYIGVSGEAYEFEDQYDTCLFIEKIEPGKEHRFGNGLFWGLQDGVLTISGEGEIYSEYNEYGWADKRDEITKIVIADGVKSIADDVFCGYEALTEVELPDSLEGIGYGCFGNCYNLISVVMSDDLRKNLNPHLGDAFWETLWYENLTPLIDGMIQMGMNSLPMSEYTQYYELSVEESGYYTVSYDDALTYVRFYDAEWEEYDIISEFWTEDDCYAVKVHLEAEQIYYLRVVNSDISTNLFLDKFVLGGSLENNMTWTLKDGILTISGEGDMPYLSSRPWYDEEEPLNKVVIEEGITSISEGLFEMMEEITEVSLPSSLRAIEHRAFCGCNGLTAIEIPESVERIDRDAFSYCEFLEEVSISEDLLAHISIIDVFRNTPWLRNHLPVESLLQVGSNEIQVEGTSTKYYQFVPPINGTYSVRFFCDDSYDWEVSWYNADLEEIEMYDTYELSAAQKYYCAVQGFSDWYDFPLEIRITKLADPAHTGTMWYRYADGNLDIRGYANDDDNAYTIQTTFADRGYETYLRYRNESDNYNQEYIALSNDGESAEPFGGLVITPNLRFSDDGTYVIVQYVVTNTSDARKTYDLGVCADVDVDGDDYAEVHLTDTGLRMVSDRDRTYYLICRNVEGVTDADTMWMGYYGQRTYNLYNDTEDNSLTNTDSGLAFSWKDNSLAPGESAVFVYQIGIGEAGSIVEPDLNLIARGSCGESLTWSLNDEGKLSIKGSGAMFDYAEGAAPWASYADSIQRINIGYSVTSLGANAFFGCMNLSGITIPSRVQSIGEHALGWSAEGKKEDFVITGFVGTEAQYYAAENEFTFDSLGAENGAGHVHHYAEDVHAATCLTAGYTIFTCIGCGDERRGDEVAALGHSFTDYVSNQDATYEADGTKTADCDRHCGVKDTIADIGSKLPRIEISTTTITLAQTSYKYDGNAKTPSVTVTDGDVTLASESDYVVSYGNNINAGTAKVTITGTGKYTGSVEKTFTITRIANVITASNVTKSASAKDQSFSIGATRKGAGKLTYKSSNKSVKVSADGKVTIVKKFVGKATITIKVAANGNYKAASKKITITVNPTKTNLSSLANTKGAKLVIKWAKNTVGCGYQIQYSTDKNFKNAVKTVNVTKNGTVSKTISKLTKGKTYFVRIRSLKTVSKVKYYSAWSALKSIKITK